MKRIRYFVISVLCGIVMIITLGSHQTVMADDTTLTGNTMINVIAPSQDALTIQSAPNFSFGSVKLTKTNQSFMAKGDTPYVISDLTGVGGPFEMQVKVSDFTAKDQKDTLPVSSFVLSFSDTTCGGASLISGVNVYNTAGTVLKANNGLSGVHALGDVSATMVMQPNSKVKVGQTYSAVVTSTLVVGVQ